MSLVTAEVRKERVVDRKAQRRQVTVDRVLRAAREILASDGPEGLSLRKLSAKAGLSPNTIYAHFDNQRAGIIGAVVADALTDIGEIDDSELGLFGPGPTPWEAAVEQYLAHPEFYRSISVLRSPEQPFTRERRNMIKLGLGAQRLLAGGVSDGLLRRDTDLTWLAEHLALLFRGVADSWARHELDSAAFRRHVLYGVYSALHVNATSAGRRRCATLLRASTSR
jgi:AcrR family transcriptional regulator